MKQLLAGFLALFALAAVARAEPPPMAAHAMVAAANPLAAQAGLKVLRDGGSAIDAAVAIQAVLALVEPQSSSLSGGAFMVYYDAATRTTVGYDGREFAPAGATPQMFLNPDGTVMSYPEAVLSGRSTGVPGAIAMLYLAHQQHGRKPWGALFADGERLASDGFAVSPRLAGMITSRAPQTSAPDVVRYFTKADGGGEYKAGDILKNPAYAASLRKVAAEGPRAILTGPIAADIVARLRQDPIPGTMTLADLAAYKPKAEPAVCRPYRVYVVCVPGAPSGGPALLEGLGLLERTDIASRGPTDPQAWLELAEAERLMYADRDYYEGDPAFAPFPQAGLLDPAYLDARARLIGDQAAATPPAHGLPAGAPKLAADATLEPGGTTHFVIVDAAGNVVSMTTTVESIFGDGRMVDGFFLNNQLTDFSFAPREPDGTRAANAVGPHKRPRSSMAPAIILDRQGRFVGAIGSPGGNSIPSYVLKGIVAVIDWHMPLDDAFALPNLVARGGNFSSEPQRYPPGVVAGLAAKGVVFRNNPYGEDSGLHGIIVRPGGYEGGADPRREGVAIGF